MLTLTVSLGIWQIERLKWKQGLLQAIDQGEAAPAIPLSDRPAAFSRVSVQGRYLPLLARYGAEVRSSAGGAAMGAHVISPLSRDGGVPILVDRGWTPLDQAVDTPEGPVRLEGYVRPPETAAWSAAADDLARRRFFTLDPAKIGLSLGLPAVAPFTLVLLGPPGASPEPAQRLPRPPNDHLSYAITWFSLSAVLVVVFLLYARQALSTKAAHDRL